MDRPTPRILNSEDNLQLLLVLTAPIRGEKIASL